MTPIPPTTPPPAGTQTPRTQAVIDAFADSGCKDMQPVFDFARQLERETIELKEKRTDMGAVIVDLREQLAAAIKERDEARRVLTQAFIDKNEALDQLAAAREGRAT